MHEISIAANIMEITCEVCRKNKIKKAKKINIKVGELKAIVPDLLIDAFKMVSKGTACENSEIKVKVLPVKFSCVECDNEVKQSDSIKCGKCCSVRVKLMQGNEFIIESVEGE